VTKDRSGCIPPVSLTVTLCKIFESILMDKIVENLEKHEFIRESQHLFVRKSHVYQIC